MGTTAVAVQRVRARRRARLAGRVRRIVVATIGASVLLVGLVLILLPGPATLVIPLGLTILASEFPAARRLQRRALRAFRGVVARSRRTPRVDRPRHPAGSGGSD